MAVPLGIRKVLFDWDGTVVDSLETIARANCAIIKQLGGSEVSVETWHEECGLHWQAFFVKYGVPQEKLGEVLPLMDEFRPRFAEYTELNPNVVTSLRELRSRRIGLGVLSGSNRLGIEADIKRFGLERKFEFVIAGEDLREPKPSPYGLDRAATRFGTPPSYIAYVEDQPAIFPVAKARGFTVIGYRTPDNGKTYADAVITDFAELPKLILKK